MPKITNYVGIDMAKNDFYACLNDIDEPKKFNNDTKGIKSFLTISSIIISQKTTHSSV